MHALVILTLCAASFCDFIAASSPALALVKFIPEVLSGLIAALVLFEGVRGGFANVSAKYWLIFGVAVFVIVCGIFTNDVGAGPVVAGMRSYLRAIPLFMIPAVFPFSDKQLQQQIKVVLAIALIQVPITCYQRYTVWTQGRFSGDDVRGTVMESGILSIFLVCVALVLVGYFMRGRLSKVSFFTLFFLVLLPTTINETKATVVLLPIGLLTTIVAGSARGKRLRVFSMGVALLAVFGAIMVPVYDLMAANNPYKNERHLLDFFTNQKEMDKYMNTKGGAGIGTMHFVRRGDAIRVPIEYLSRDPVRLSFGLGLGNASHSNLGQAFVGTYYDLFQYFAVLSFSIFLLEIGLLGTGLVFLLNALLFFDAVAVARSDKELHGAIAIGWIGVVAVMTTSMFYSAIHVYTVLPYMYWYFAGVVATRRTRLAMAESTPTTVGELRRSAALRTARGGTARIGR